MRCYVARLSGARYLMLGANFNRCWISTVRCKVYNIHLIMPQSHNSRSKLVQYDQLMQCTWNSHNKRMQLKLLESRKCDNTLLYEGWKVLWESAQAFKLQHNCMWHCKPLHCCYWRTNDILLLPWNNATKNVEQMQDTKTQNTHTYLKSVPTTAGQLLLLFHAYL